MDKNLKIAIQAKFIIKLITILMITFSGNVFAKESHQESLPSTKKVNNLTILSEDNMAYPLVKIARLYSESNNSIVSINFNNSHQLITDIEAGEPADVFISSHPNWIDDLKQKGLVDVYNLANLATDSLVLVTSKNNNKIDTTKINQLQDSKTIFREMRSQHNKLIIDSSHSSLGKYTNTILKQDNLANQTVYRKNIDDKKPIADFINENNEYYGIILTSSVLGYDNILILKTIEDIEIHYQAIVIAGNNMDKARDFLEFIKSRQVKDIFAESGFIVE
jgi:molybdate transport system substrate-binding protein